MKVFGILCASFSLCLYRTIDAYNCTMCMYASMNGVSAGGDIDCRDNPAAMPMTDCGSMPCSVMSMTYTSGDDENHEIQMFERNCTEQSTLDAFTYDASDKCLDAADLPDSIKMDMGLTETEMASFQGTFCSCNTHDMCNSRLGVSDMKKFESKTPDTVGYECASCIHVTWQGSTIEGDIDCRDNPAAVETEACPMDVCSLSYFTYKTDDEMEVGVTHRGCTVQEDLDHWENPSKHGCADASELPAEAVAALNITGNYTDLQGTFCSCNQGDYCNIRLTISQPNKHPDMHHYMKMKHMKMKEDGMIDEKGDMKEEMMMGYDEMMKEGMMGDEMMKEGMMGDEMMKEGMMMEDGMMKDGMMGYDDMMKKGMMMDVKGGKMMMHDYMMYDYAMKDDVMKDEMEKHGGMKEEKADGQPLMCKSCYYITVNGGRFAGDINCLFNPASVEDMECPYGCYFSSYTYTNPYAMEVQAITRECAEEAKMKMLYTSDEMMYKSCFDGRNVSQAFIDSLGIQDATYTDFLGTFCYCKKRDDCNMMHPSMVYMQKPKHVHDHMHGKMHMNMTKYGMTKMTKAPAKTTAKVTQSSGDDAGELKSADSSAAMTSPAVAAILGAILA